MCSWLSDKRDELLHFVNFFCLAQVNPDEVTVGEDFSFSYRKESQKKAPPFRPVKDINAPSIAPSGSTASGAAGPIADKTIGRIMPGIYPISVNCGAGYMDPIPVAMQSIRILDLATVDINWRMLTVVRPTTKLDEEYFTK